MFVFIKGRQRWIHGSRAATANISSPSPIRGRHAFFGHPLPNPHHHPYSCNAMRLCLCTWTTSIINSNMRLCVIWGAHRPDDIIYSIWLIDSAALWWWRICVVVRYKNADADMLVGPNGPVVSLNVLIGMMVLQIYPDSYEFWRGQNRSWKNRKFVCLLVAGWNVNAVGRCGFMCCVHCILDESNGSAHFSDVWSMICNAWCIIYLYVGRVARQAQFSK